MEGIYAYADQIKVYKAILDATQEVQAYLRYNSGKLVYKIYNQTLFPFIQYFLTIQNYSPSSEIKEPIRQTSV